MLNRWEEESRAIHAEKSRCIRKKQWKQRIYGGLAVCSLAYGALLGWWVWHSGELAKLEQRLQTKWQAALDASGMTVQRVAIDGQQRLSPELIVKQSGLEPGQLILTLSIEQVKQRLEAHPQIASANVERHMPDKVSIHLTERSPAVIWQHKGQQRWLSSDGTPLDAALASPYSAKRFPVISGAGAPEAWAQLHAMVNETPSLKEAFVGAQYVGQRRWTVFLKNDVKVLLPMNDPNHAWQQLATWQEQFSLLDRAVQRIDMRLAERAFITYAPSEDGSPEEVKRLLTAQVAGAI